MAASSMISNFLGPSDGDGILPRITMVIGSLLADIFPKLNVLGVQHPRRPFQERASVSKRPFLGTPALAAFSPTSNVNDSETVEVKEHSLDEDSDNDEDFNINSLPEEILILIFGYLNHNDLHRIACVCRKWKKCASYPVLWKNVDLKLSYHHGNQNEAVAKFFKRIPHHVSHLRIDFSNCYISTEPLNFEHFASVLHASCPDLQTLILQNVKLSDSLPSVIDICAEFLENVRVLAIYYSIFNRIIPTRVKYGNISKIQVLNLFGCWGLKYPFSQTPFIRMPYLRKLFLTSTDVHSFLFPNDVSFVKQLDKLDLGYTHIESWIFRRIWKFGLNLRELYICHALVKDSDFNFSDSENMLPHLRTVCVRFCAAVTHVGVRFLIQSCETLENVYVDTSFPTHCLLSVNKCKQKIVKFVSACSHYQRVNYLHG